MLYIYARYVHMYRMCIDIYPHTHAYTYIQPFSLVVVCCLPRPTVNSKPCALNPKRSPQSEASDVAQGSIIHRFRVLWA